METTRFSVIGMTCNGCVKSVTRALRSIEGVYDVAVSLTSGAATVRYDEQLTSIAGLKGAVQGAGYDVSESVSAAPPQGQRSGCCGG